VSVRFNFERRERRDTIACFNMKRPAKARASAKAGLTQTTEVTRWWLILREATLSVTPLSHDWRKQAGQRLGCGAGGAGPDHSIPALDRGSMANGNSILA
jgi:hypothetical protein